MLLVYSTHLFFYIGVCISCIANRIERLEFLDEKELLTQLLQHYCVSCGYNDKKKIGEFIVVCMWSLLRLLINWMFILLCSARFKGQCY